MSPPVTSDVEAGEPANHHSTLSSRRIGENRLRVWRRFVVEVGQKVAFLSHVG
jgi:hypothetical protein